MTNRRILVGVGAALAIGGIGVFPAPALADGPAGSISGFASQPGINPFDFDPRVQVSLLLDDGVTWIDSTVSSNDRYELAGVPDGSYLILFEPYDSNSSFSPEWWNDVGETESAQVVVVADGQAVRGIDGILSWGASVSGHVLLANGASRLDAGEIDVRALGEGGRRSTSGVGSDGSYTIAGLDPGVYRIEFYPDGTNGYQPEDYGTLITITGDEDIGGIDVVLGSNQISLTGTVTGDGVGIANAAVSLIRSDGVATQQAITDARGSFAFNGVPSASYKLTVSEASGRWLARSVPVEIRLEGSTVVAVTLEPVSPGQTVPSLPRPADPPVGSVSGVIAPSPVAKPTVPSSEEASLAVTGWSPATASFAGFALMALGIFLAAVPRSSPRRRLPAAKLPKAAG
ncbi:carboxypeptidase regulatory-like domain-containing protein [Microbacterium sp. P05]|uniref:carboxypeptidase regulatory-like domain-containing protein n=1 Tax=Microbacterium sp. P05 TaxID=3366948 RepID=UPI003746C73C